MISTANILYAENGHTLYQRIEINIRLIQMVHEDIIINYDSNAVSSDRPSASIVLGKKDYYSWTSIKRPPAGFEFMAA